MAVKLNTTAFDGDRKTGVLLAVWVNVEAVPTVCINTRAGIYYEPAGGPDAAPVVTLYPAF